MNPVNRNFVIACGFGAFFTLFLIFAVWEHRAGGSIDGHDSASANGAGEQTTPPLPPIHQTYRQLKEEIAAIVADKEEGPNPFYTAYFEPPPPPPPEEEPDEEEEEPDPPPPEPPPETVVKKIPLRYQGFFETSEGERKAYLLKENELMIVSPGDTVIEDWSVHEIGAWSLHLTDGADETYELAFNRPQEIEIEVKREEE